MYYTQRDDQARVQALSVARKLQQARNYTLSADDIGRILKEKREKGLVKRSLAMMKADLVLKRNAALEVGDDAAAAQCASLPPRSALKVCAILRSHGVSSWVRVHLHGHSRGASRAREGGPDTEVSLSPLSGQRRSCKSSRRSKPAGRHSSRVRIACTRSIARWYSRTEPVPTPRRSRRRAWLGGPASPCTTPTPARPQRWCSTGARGARRARSRPQHSRRRRSSSGCAALTQLVMDSLPCGATSVCTAGSGAPRASVRQGQYRAYGRACPMLH